MGLILEQTERIELSSQDWKSRVLPLNYAPIELTSDIIARYFLILQELGASLS